MHSRIFQVSTKPIHKDDYIEESNYYDHWFLSSIADYVNENTDRENDIHWLESCYKDRGLSFGVDDGGEYFIIEDKIKYFMSKFENFKKSIGKLSMATIEEFISGEIGMSMYNLKESYDDKFGFYADGDDTGMVTFDDLIRHSNVTKYYIGATIDYHF